MNPENNPQNNNLSNNQSSGVNLGQVAVDNPQPQQPVVNQASVQTQAQPLAQPAQAYQPTYSQQPQNNQHSSTQTKKKRAKKVKLFAAMALFAFVILAGTAYAYFSVIVPNRPENKIARSFFNLVSVEKSGADMAVNLQVNGQGSDLGSNFSMTMPMSYDYDGNKLQLSVGLKDIEIEVDSFSNFNGLNPDSLNLSSIDLNAETIISSEDNKLYVRVTGMDSLIDVISSFSEQFGASKSEIQEFEGQLKEVFAVIENKWIVTDSEEEVSFSQLNDLVECVSGDEINISSDDVIDTYNNNKFIEIVGEPEEVTLRETSLTKYTVKMLMAEYEKFGEEMNVLIDNDTSLSKCLASFEDEIDTAGDVGTAVSGDTEVSLPDDYSFDVWIDEDENIRQMSFGIDDELAAGAFTIQMDFRNAVTIDIPLDATTSSQVEKNINEVVEEYQTDLTINPIESDVDPEVKARNDQRRDDAVRLLATMENYADDNFGNYPTDKKEMQEAVTDYMSAQKFEDPSTGFSYSVDYTDFSPSQIGIMSYSAEAQCVADTIFPSDSGDKRDIAVEVYLEEDFFCIDNS